MIEGLKVTISGPELTTLCLMQADWHGQRAAFYAEKAKQLEGVVVRPQGSSYSDPADEMKNKRREHENLRDELTFIAKHLDAAEQYILGQADLAKIGIVKNRHAF